MNDKEILTALNEKMLTVLIDLEQKLNRNFPVPELQLKKLGKLAGRSSFVMNIVQINPDFCRNGHWDDMLNVTLPHELAHIVADTIYSEDYYKKHIDMRYTPHGKLWKAIMELIGLPPNIYHTMSMTGVSENPKKELRRPHVYRCGCCLHHLSELKHRRFVNGLYEVFKCAFCKGELTYIGREESVNNLVNN